MTRSSWHHYWRLMTVFSGLACLLFAMAAASNANPPGSAALVKYPADVQMAYYALAQASATLLAVFFGVAAVSFGLAWAACAMALREKKEAARLEKVQQTAVSESSKGGIVDAYLRT